MQLPWPHQPPHLPHVAAAHSSSVRVRCIWRMGLAIACAVPWACTNGLVANAQPLHATAARPGGVAPPSQLAPLFTRAELLDSATCAGCHPAAYAEWEQSPHASAADDPVFLAMNRMAQRETHGALGNFCVQCHAPLAVREGATQDGLNLRDVPTPLKGVTCYFCHDVDSVAGNHNNPLKLAGDLTMRGPLKDAVTTTAHHSAYSSLHDRNTLASSQLCGSCHDVVTPPGAKLESTFAEWQASVYAHNVTGQSCSGCHMPQSPTPTAISEDTDAPPRFRHAHSFPGLDLPMPQTPRDGPPAVKQDMTFAQKDLASLLDRTLQTALCVKQVGDKAALRVVLDNVGAGHAFTSGAVQDRRLWVEVIAYHKGKVIYQSGVVPENQAVMDHLDDDIWLVRSCMFDQEGKPTSHFWNAASIDSNPLPTIATFNPSDPNFYRSNVVRNYPNAPLGTLSAMPDKVTMRVLIEPIGLDLLDELVASHDLAPEVRRAARRVVVGPTQELTWTAQTAQTGYQEHGVAVRCATTSNINLTGLLTPAPTHHRCKL
jgi:hypothetical protein